MVYQHTRTNSHYKSYQIGRTPVRLDATKFPSILNALFLLRILSDLNQCFQLCPIRSTGATIHKCFMCPYRSCAIHSIAHSAFCIFHTMGPYNVPWLVVLEVTRIHRNFSVAEVWSAKVSSPKVGSCNNDVGDGEHIKHLRTGAPVLRMGHS